MPLLPPQALAKKSSKPACYYSRNRKSVVHETVPKVATHLLYHAESCGPAHNRSSLLSMGNLAHRRAAPPSLAGADNERSTELSFANAIAPHVLRLDRTEQTGSGCAGNQLQGWPLAAFSIEKILGMLGRWMLMLWCCGAQEGTRTPTMLPPPAPESGASTNSATWARPNGLRETGGLSSGFANGQCPNSD